MSFYQKNKIAVIGMGYVGLPLAIEFGKKFVVQGFDINNKRISQLKKKIDITSEVSVDEFYSAKYLNFTNKIETLKDCNIFIITVPTPITRNNIPDLSYLSSASEMVGNILKENDIIIYESTVYPGVTEDHCVPIIEKRSGLIFNKNFYVGYSPERVNPGDKLHRIPNLVKITSGSTKQTALLVNEIYSSIIKVGTYMAESIKVAEAAKVIENIQRDLNISLINELSIIFNLLGIDTEAVINAASTKWNFMPFKPGLVGGHCIGIDPYYLTFKAQQLGYSPDIILAGRKLNNSMSSYIASELIKEMTKLDIKIKNAKILIMGLTFKENCPDIRNTQVLNLLKELESFHCDIDVYDPLVNINLIKREQVKLINNIKQNYYDGLILAVSHEEFKKMGIKKIKSFTKKNSVIYDLKHMFDKKHTTLRL